MFNAGHAFTDSHSGQRRATRESTLSNARYAIGDSDRGQRRANPESILSNTRYAVGGIVVSNGFGNNY